MSPVRNSTAQRKGRKASHVARAGVISNGVKKKVLVVTGTRAEWGLLHPIVTEIQKSKKLSLKLLVTGMHTLPQYGSTGKEITNARVPIDCVVPVTKNSSMLTMLAEEIRGIEQYCLKNRPDLILVLGDRDEPLAGALVAAHLNIPLAHIHGGDVSGPGVDEYNRTLITKLAHMHFPATKKSAERIKRLGEEMWRITVTGTPGLDGIGTTGVSRERIARILRLDAKKPWMLFVQHPVAHERAPLIKQIASLHALRSFPEYERIVIYPNNDSGSDVFISQIQKLSSNYHVFPSLPRAQFITLLKESETIIGNSSSGIIEANFLGTPAVDIGDRQKGREHGVGVIHTSYDQKHILRAIHAALRMKKRLRGRSIPSPYGSGNAGSRIVSRIVTLISHPRLALKR